MERILFNTFSEQYTNRLLAVIGKAAGVDFKIKNHTARHTFGTLFIELGGDVVTLKDYMGHRDLGTTMKYVHISEKRKKRSTYPIIYSKKINNKLLINL